MLQLTPSQESAQRARVERLQRFARHTVPDRPIRILSASERTAEAPSRPFKVLPTRHVLTEAEIHALVWPSIPIELPSSFPGPKISLIQEIVARHYHVRPSDICSSRRTADVVRPRQVAMYLAKTLTLRSLPEIGRRFGGRDHTTAIHAIKKISGMIETDATFAAEIEGLQTEIMGGVK